MHRIKLVIALFAGTFSANLCIAQTELKPGFNRKEYTELLKVSARQLDTLRKDSLPAPKEYKMIYRSPIAGLQNRWDLWRDAKGHAVISIRGTTASDVSWIENFYGAMVPATGSLSISNTLKFDYKLAENPRAMVHVGWLSGLAALSPTLILQIKKLHADGVKQITIMGHSQGGAIAYLLRSYIFYQTKAGKIPADIIWKTYCSAAPKPGNLYYAYDFDHITEGGWAFNVVNELDWVPETPFSIQTVTDYNAGNPFNRELVKAGLKKQSFMQRLFVNIAYKQLDNRTRKAQKVMAKYLGKIAFKAVKKTLPQFREPEYSAGNNYQRAGTAIILMPDSAYYKAFPQVKGKVFRNHQPDAYYWLMNHRKE